VRLFNVRSFRETKLLQNLPEFIGKSGGRIARDDDRELQSDLEFRAGAKFWHNLCAEAVPNFRRDSTGNTHQSCGITRPRSRAEDGVGLARRRRTRIRLGLRAWSTSRRLASPLRFRRRLPQQEYIRVERTAFKTGRNFAAWIGLVPKQNSSGAKERLGSITKAGNRYLRQMPVVGAMAVIRYAERHGTRRPWLIQLMQRRSTKVAAVALANKTARIIWAMMMSGERYREPTAAGAAAA
jgi:transposase